MLSDAELRQMLSELESERVERTVSTTNKDKLCEAICAFANDLAGHRRPGYLLIGANDRGDVEGVKATDQLCIQISNFADYGQILPTPTFHLDVRLLDDKQLIVVEVEPSDHPPVRYKGRVYIRRGPRKAIANEQEERILTEKRAHHSRTFDLLPCRDCRRGDLAMELFLTTYRAAAIAPEILEENNREALDQLASLGFWSADVECATNAGAILFAADPQTFFPGAYIQYVRYEGDELSDEILDERRFDGDLLTLLRELDGFLKTMMPARPVQDSALHETMLSPYPLIALRELLMNAVMHRDYQSNAPIRFYWFQNRIEIQNPGGLYGSVTVETFPNQNDYRNPKISEAMKTLGYVNRFGRGLARVDRALRDNGNPPAEYDIGQPSQFLVIIREASLDENSHSVQ